MTLSLTKSITLDGSSKVGEIIVQTMHAAASSDGSTFNTSTNVLNQELYSANKSEMRKDISDFQTAAYDVQDSLAQTTSEEDSAPDTSEDAVK